MIIFKSAYEIGLMREVGHIVAGSLDLAATLVRPGLTTAELDRAIEQYFRDQGCEPLFKGYRGYPATICTSVNEEIVHGIPGPRVLKEGDIIGIDLGARRKGYCGDAAMTFPVGTISPKASRLISVCREALEIGLRLVRPGARISELGAAIQGYVESHGYSVVKDFTGHGIGTNLHEEPQVPNFVNAEVRRRDTVLKSGMVIAIEPMVNEGTDAVDVLKDRWTAVTRDRKLSAHFEDTIAVLKDGAEILTRKPALR